MEARKIVEEIRNELLDSIEELSTRECRHMKKNLSGTSGNTMVEYVGRGHTLTGDRLCEKPSGLGVQSLRAGACVCSTARGPPRKKSGALFTFRVQASGCSKLIRAFDGRINERLSSGRSLERRDGTGASLKGRHTHLCL